MRQILCRAFVPAPEDMTTKAAVTAGISTEHSHFPAIPEYVKYFWPDDYFWPRLVEDSRRSLSRRRMMPASNMTRPRPTVNGGRVPTRATHARAQNTWSVLGYRRSAPAG
jgi:hypothetical protein